VARFRRPRPDRGFVEEQAVKIEYPNPWYRRHLNKLGHGLVESVIIERTEEIVMRLLPDGHRSGQEWITRNPCREDHSPGSFRVNLISGKWADFAYDAKGSNVIWLAKFVCHLSTYKEARTRLAYLLDL
jgi:hypothetical protein